MQMQVKANANIQNQSKKDSSLNKRTANNLSKLIYEQRYLFLMSMPFVIWVLVFRYLPLWGWTMAFQNYKPAKGFF